MGLFKRIDEALATVQECHRLAAKYAEYGMQSPETGLIRADRSVVPEQPLLSA
jgi:hypothetical protein